MLLIEFQIIIALQNFSLQFQIITLDDIQYQNVILILWIKFTMSDHISSSQVQMATPMDQPRIQCQTLRQQTLLKAVISRSEVVFSSDQRKATKNNYRVTRLCCVLWLSGKVQARHRHYFGLSSSNLKAYSFDNPSFLRKKHQLF